MLEIVSTFSLYFPLAQTINCFRILFVFPLEASRRYHEIQKQRADVEKILAQRVEKTDQLLGALG